MQDDGLSEQERQLEAGLKGLQPVAGLDRDALMFAAGRRAERRRLWGWRTTAGILAAGWLVTIGLMGLGVTNHGGGAEGAKDHLQVVGLDSGPQQGASTLSGRSLRLNQAKGVPDDSSSGLLMLLGFSTPIEHSTSGPATVLNLRDRVLTYGVAILPTQRGDGTNSSGKKPAEKATPTYGSALRNNQGEQL